MRGCLIGVRKWLIGSLEGGHQFDRFLIGARTGWNGTHFFQFGGLLAGGGVGAHLRSTFRGLCPPQFRFLRGASPNRLFGCHHRRRPSWKRGL